MPIINDLDDAQQAITDLTDRMAALFTSVRNLTKSMNFYLIDKMTKDFTGPITPSLKDLDINFIMGPPGPEGIQGVQGIQGPRGYPGAGFNIMGVVDTEADLPADADQGDAYFVRQDDDDNNNFLFIWAGHPDGWIRTDFKGPQGDQGIQGIQGPAGPFYTPTVEDLGNGKFAVTFKSPGQPDVGPVTAQAPDGPPGVQGPAGNTPYINAAGTWQIGNYNTGVKAEGQAPVIGGNGNWVINGVDSGLPSRGATGLQGPTGAVYTPSVVVLGDNIISITWTAPGLPNVGPVALVAPKGETGDTGPQGQRGEIGGYYVPNLHISASPDTFTLGFDPTDPTYPAIDTITVTAPTGPQGIQGIQGIPGIYYTPVVNTITYSQITIDWTAPSLPNVGLVTLTAPQGDQGIQGIQGIPGNDAPELLEGSDIEISWSGDIPPKQIISAPAISELREKLNEIESAVIEIEDFTQTYSIASQKITIKDFDNGTISVETKTLHPATLSYSGLMTPSNLEQIASIASDVEFLKLQSDSNHRTAIVEILTDNEQATLTAAFEEQFPSAPPQATDRLIETSTEKQWIFDNAGQWQEITTSNLALATSINFGLVKHDTNAGNIAYNSPGIGSVNGWSGAIGAITANANAISTINSTITEMQSKAWVPNVEFRWDDLTDTSITFDLNRKDHAIINTDDVLHLNQYEMTAFNKTFSIPNQSVQLGIAQQLFIIIDNSINKLIIQSLSGTGTQSVRIYGSLTKVSASGNGIISAELDQTHALFIANNGVIMDDVQVHFLAWVDARDEAANILCRDLIEFEWSNGSSSPTVMCHSLKSDGNQANVPSSLFRYAYNNQPGQAGLAIWAYPLYDENYSISMNILGWSVIDNEVDITPENPWLEKFSLVNYSPNVDTIPMNNIDGWTVPAANSSSLQTAYNQIIKPYFNRPQNPGRDTTSSNQFKGVIIPTVNSQRQPNTINLSGSYLWGVTPDISIWAEPVTGFNTNNSNPYVNFCNVTLGDTNVNTNLSLYFDIYYYNGYHVPSGGVVNHTTAGMTFRSSSAAPLDWSLPGYNVNSFGNAQDPPKIYAIKTSNTTYSLWFDCTGFQAYHSILVYERMSTRSYNVANQYQAGNWAVTTYPSSIQFVSSMGSGTQNWLIDQATRIPFNFNPGTNISINAQNNWFRRGDGMLHIDVLASTGASIAANGTTILNKPAGGIGYIPPTFQAKRAVTTMIATAGPTVTSVAYEVVVPSSDIVTVRTVYLNNNGFSLAAGGNLAIQQDFITR